MRCDIEKFNAMKAKLGYPNLEAYFIDWKSGKLNIVKGSSQKQSIMSNLPQFLEKHGKSPIIIIMESSFESYLLEDKDAFILRCRAEGHIFKLTSSRSTAWKRKANGFEKDEKSDKLDAFMIRQVAIDGGHLKTPLLSSECDNTHINDVRKVGCRILMLLRASEDLQLKKRGRGYSKNPPSQKDQWAIELIRRLPEYTSIDTTLQLALGDGETYNDIVLPAVAMASLCSKNQKEFDKICGLYSHGYPSQIRSDLHFHCWRRVQGKVTWTQFRKSLRWLFHQFKAAGVPDPVIPS